MAAIDQLSYSSPSPGKYRPNTEVAYASPALDPPSSCSGNVLKIQPKRVRRTEGSSESEAASIIGDNEIYNGDFRSGGPYLVRLPARVDHFTRHDPLQVAWEDKLEAPVRSIIKRYSIDVIGVGPIRRLSLVSADKHDTGLITARKHDVTSDSWFKACKEILQLFRSEGFIQLNVEIIDERATPRLLIYPVARNDPFVNAWDILRPIVLDILGEADWTLLYVVRRMEENCIRDPITIAITVTEESTDEWTIVRDKIVQLLDSRGHSTVAVEIYRGNILQAILYQEPALHSQDWDDRAKAGGSLSPQGSTKFAATLGGFVELQYDVSGPWKSFGMTNFQSVIAEAGLHPLYNRWVREGIKPGDIRNDLQMDHPAPRDHEPAIQYYKEYLDEARRGIRNNIHSRVIQPGQSALRVEERDEFLQAIFNELKETILKATSFGKEQRYLGPVYAGSGFRVSPQKQRLDWALVDVGDRRIANNKIPNREMDSRYQISYAPLEPVMAGTATVAEGCRVFKVGRGTGFTGGTVNGIKFADVQTRVTNAQGLQEYVRGTALVVLPWGCKTFGDPGDSGSFVMNEKGQFVGLYVGGDRHRGCGFIVEAESLLENIKIVTKCHDVRI